MAFNGSGVFNRLYSWVADAAASIKISSTRMDAEMDGMATGLSTCLTKDGQTTPTANLPMGTFRHTGVGDSTSLTSYPSTKQIQNGALTYDATDTGAANAYVTGLSPAPSAYTDGLDIYLKIANTNTGASTINVNSLGVKNIKTVTGADPSAGAILAGQIAYFKYDGTNFQLMGISDPLKANLTGANFSGPVTVPAGATGSQVPRKSEVAGLANANVFTTYQTISNLDPQLILIDTDAAVDNRRWSIISEAETLRMRAVNDANTVATDFLTVNRTGTTIDDVTLGGTIVAVTNALTIGGSAPVMSVGGTSPIASSGGTTPTISINAIDSDSKIAWADTAGLKSSFFKFPPSIDFVTPAVNDQSISTPVTTLVPVYADNTLVTDTIPIYIPPSSATLTYEAFEKSNNGAVFARFRFNVGATDGTESTTNSTTLAWGSSATIDVSALSGWTLFTCKMGVSSAGGYIATVSRVRWRISG